MVNINIAGHDARARGARAPRLHHAATARVLLWLFVIGLGTAFGAGIYEARIVVSDWLATTADGHLRWDAGAATAADTGRRFWAWVSTGPLTLLGLASLIVAWRMRGPARGPWLTAGFIALAERTLTFAYFIPTMIGLMSAADSPQAIETAQTWTMLNHARHLLVFAAWMAATAALTRLDPTQRPTAPADDHARRAPGNRAVPGWNDDRRRCAHRRRRNPIDGDWLLSLDSNQEPSG